VRGWRRFAPLAPGLVATAVVLGGFGWLGTPLSIGMLAFLPVMLGVGTDLPIQAAHPARRRVLLGAAAAGASAFAALGLSPLPFVRHLGLALAAGVLVSAVLAMASMRSPVGDLATGQRMNGAGRKMRSSVAGVGTDERMSGRGRWPGLAAGVVVAAVGWVLLPSLPVEARPERLARGLPALADARRTERVLGASGEVAVRVTAGDVASPEMLAWFRQADEALVVRFGDRLRPIVAGAAAVVAG
jgi:hypothetical protein